MLMLGGQSTQLGKSLCNFAGITSDNVDPRGGQSTLNLGSHFATLLGLPLTMLILGGWSMMLGDTQLGKSLCNFAGITSDNVDPGGQSTLNLGSHFATLLGLPLTMLILGGQSTLNLGSHFATLLGLPLTMLNQLTLNLGSHCNFAGITSDNVDPWGTGVRSTLNFGSHFATLVGLLLTMLIQGG